MAAATTYTDREIDLQLAAIREDIKEYREDTKAYRDADKNAHEVMYAKLETIEEQTIKTNGRVNKLERFVLIAITAFIVLFADKPELFRVVVNLLHL